MTLQGSIDSFPLADVLRLLGSTHKSGALVLAGDRGTASLWLDGGGVVGAMSSFVVATPLGGPLGAVLFDMLRYEQGSFEFEANSMCSEPLAPVPVDELLEQGERDMAEWHAITEVIPRITCELELVGELAGREVIVDRRLWAGIVAMGGGSSIEAMAERLALSDLPAMRLGADLITAGLALVAVSSPESVTTAARVIVPTPFDPAERESGVLAQFRSEPVMSEPPTHAAEFESAPAFALDGFASDTFTPVDDADLDALFATPPATEPQDLSQQMAGLSPHAARAIAAATANDDPVSQGF